MSEVELFNFLKRSLGVIIKRLEESGVLVDSPTIRRSLRPNSGAKILVDLSVPRNNSSLIEELDLREKALFHSLTILKVGTGNYTIRLYFPTKRYVEFSNNELVEGWIFECLFTDLKMTNSPQTGVENPMFFVDWFEGD